MNTSNKVTQFLYKRISRLPLMPVAGPYLLVISNERRFVWFKVPKVATRTIYAFLKNHNVRLQKVRSGFLYYSPGLFTGYFKFGFLRNPWDRLVSCWSDKVVKLNYFEFPAAEREKMQRFENFVEYVASLDMENCDHHLRLQSQLIDLRHIDYLGRLETFDDDFNCICRQLNLDPKEMTRRNPSPRTKSYEDYYDLRLRDKVAGIYRKDIQAFGYKFSEKGPGA